MSQTPSGVRLSEIVLRLGCEVVSEFSTSPCKAEVETAVPSRDRSAQAISASSRALTEPDAKWKISFARNGGLTEVTVDNQSGAVIPPKSP